MSQLDCGECLFCQLFTVSVMIPCRPEGLVEANQGCKLIVAANWAISQDNCRISQMSAPLIVMRRMHWWQVMASLANAPMQIWHAMSRHGLWTPNYIGDINKEIESKFARLTSPLRALFVWKLSTCDTGKQLHCRWLAVVTVLSKMDR